MDKIEQTNATFARLKKDMPSQFSSFITFNQKVKNTSTIDTKHKELILVSLSVTTQCTWCIAIHVEGAVKAGASKDEILEAAMLAVVMGGGPKLMYMNIVYEELDKYFNS